MGRRLRERPSDEEEEEDSVALALRREDEFDLRLYIDNSDLPRWRAALDPGAGVGVPKPKERGWEEDGDGEEGGQNKLHTRARI